MKRLLVIVALVLALPCLARAQTVPAKPGPEHQRLSMFVGDWTYEGQSKATPLGPAGPVSGKMSVQFIVGGFAIEFRGAEKGPAGANDWVEIDTYDPVQKRYTWNAFDSGGGSQAVTYTFDGLTASFSGVQVSGGKPFQIRGTAAFTADLKSFVQKNEVLVNGKWLPSYEGRANKVK